MRYYKVKPEAILTAGRHREGLVPYALYTHREVEKYGINYLYLDEVSIKKTDIEWVFGHRFEIERNFDTKAEKVRRRKEQHIVDTIVKMLYNNKQIGKDKA